MKGLTTAFLVWTLISPEGGRSQAWPTHTACKDGGLEVLYQSCGAWFNELWNIHTVNTTAITMNEPLIHTTWKDLKGITTHEKSPVLKDPLQDFGFSVDQCSRHLKSNLSIRFGMILREDIKELFLDVSLFSEGLPILSYSYPICEEDLPKFSFCGRKRGEQIYYTGPVNNPGFDIPKGEYQVLLKLYNNNNPMVACANATVICS